MTRRIINRVSEIVSVSYLLCCLIARSEAWLEQKIETIHASNNGFKLRSGRRILKKSNKDSKDAKYASKDSKADRSSNGYYNYYYPGDAGFLDEDIAGDFEDMYGYIVTTDEFSYPHYVSSTKSKKSSKSDYHYVPGMSYPFYDQGKGGKSGKKVKLPYYDPHMEVGQGKGAPPKLTKPPSFPNVGPPGGPPGKYCRKLDREKRGEHVSISCSSTSTALQGSPDDPDIPDEPDGSESEAPSSMNSTEPATQTPTPTLLGPAAPADQIEEPAMAPQVGGNKIEMPTTTMNDTAAVDVTKSLVEPVAFSLYSLTYVIEDGSMPSREEDISELTAVTRSVFKQYMEDYFEEFPLSILVGFETEFVRMGTNVQNEAYVVYRSVAIFDEGSFVIPESEQLELTLEEALQPDESLWVEYISALQQLNPKNAFADTVNVAYAADTPSTSKPRASVGDSSSAVAAIAVAAAGVTVVAIGLFVLRRKRKANMDLLAEKGVGTAKQSQHSRFLLRRNIAESDTGSDTFNASLEGLQTVPLTSTNGSTAGLDGEIASIANCSSVYTSRERSTKADDWSKYKEYSFDQNESGDDCTEYSDDAIASTAEDIIVRTTLPDERPRRTSGKSHPWREVPSGELTERQRGALISADPEGETSEHKKKEAHQRSQEEAKKLQEKKLAVERAALEDWLRKEKMARLEEEERLSEEKHKAELAKIEAEEAARVAQALRAKEEQRFAAEREAFDSKLKQKEKARKYEENKLLVAKANFEAMISKEREERKALELRLLQEKKAADESLKKAEKRARDAESKIKLEQRRLKEAKEALEAKQKKFEAKNEVLRFSEEEDRYLRQLRAAEAAREEDLKASKNVERAIDIRKLQQLRFQEKEKDLDTLRLKEAEATKLAEERVKADMTSEDLGPSEGDLSNTIYDAHESRRRGRCSTCYGSPSCTVVGK
jgi:hypothetical protein